PKSAFSYQNRGSSKHALGDLDCALSDINEAIRIDPALPQPLTNRVVIWRAKEDFDRAIADTTEAIRLAKAKAPVNIMTPPGSVLISAYNQRGLAYEAKGDYDRARQDDNSTLDRVGMQKMIRDFLRNAARAQVAIVHYAGHGVQISGRNYLVPVDAQLKAGGSMTDTMMDTDTIMAGLDDQVRTNILILDACRN